MTTRLPTLGRRGEGWLGLQMALMATIVLGAVVRVAPGPSADVAAAMRLLGQTAIVGGVALILWASVTLRTRAAFSPFPRPAAGGSMVETGPYRWIRHPIYVGLIVAGLGIASSRYSILSLIATIGLAVVLDMKRRREEAWLVERFPGYRAYRQRTKALIPLVY
jgi:protein-S-isoprenylcysteine O-methyltransferase Ste14